MSEEVKALLVQKVSDEVQEDSIPLEELHN